MHRIRTTIFAGLALGASACTGPQHRPHQTVALSTEPAGAACLVTSGADAIADLPATPAALRIPQGIREVRIFCTAPGHEPTATILSGEVDVARVAVAAALIGPVPVAAVALSGGAHRYRPEFHVALPPMRFATGQERDAFFAARVAEGRRHFDRPIQANKAMCRADEFGCQHRIAEMERARDEEMSRLERARAATLAP